MSQGIVKSSSKIKEALLARWKEEGISQADVMRDAIDKGMPMGQMKKEANEKTLIQSLSRTMSDHKGAGLNEEQLIFLSYRWGVEIYLDVVIIKPYKEATALKKLYKIFPKNK